MMLMLLEVNLLLLLLLLMLLLRLLLLIWVVCTARTITNIQVPTLMASQAKQTSICEHLCSQVCACISPTLLFCF